MQEQLWLTLTRSLKANLCRTEILEVCFIPMYRLSRPIHKTACHKRFHHLPTYVGFSTTCFTNVEVINIILYDFHKQYRIHRFTNYILDLCGPNDSKKYGICCYVISNSHKKTLKLVYIYNGNIFNNFIAFSFLLTHFNMMFQLIWVRDNFCFSKKTFT